MSNYGNRNSKMPDVSPKIKRDYSPRDVGLAIGIMFIIAAATILLTIGFCNNYELDLQKATAAAQTAESDFRAKLDELVSRETDLTAREQKVAAREATVKKREATLSEQETAFEEERNALSDEKALFYSDQADIFKLTKDLYEKLAPYYETVTE